LGHNDYRQRDREEDEMTNPTRALGDEARKREEAWIREQERENLQKARRAEQRQAWRARLAQVVGVSDGRFLDDLEEHGFAPETIPLLFVSPLFMVSWSDGEVTKQEREAILEIARQRGLDPKSPAWARLEGWLAARPGPNFFEYAFGMLKRMLDANPEAKPNMAKEIVAACVRVADASGGFFGHGDRISAEEKTVLERIAADLGTPLPLPG
jgi:hypothetical protein